MTQDNPFDKDVNFNPLTDEETDDALVTDEELDLLNEEVKVLHGGDLKVAAATLLEEKAIQAVQAIAKLALHSSTDRVRLDASKYILERVLGPLSKMELEFDPDKDPLTQLLLDAGHTAAPKKQ